MRPQRRAVEPHATDISRDVCPSRARPIDLVHLARQTLGDRELELEVLGLMVRQIEQCADRIELAQDRDRGTLAHALKGAALSIGAFPLAEQARHVEEQPGDGQAKAALVAEMRRTSTFIAVLLGRSPAV